MKKVIALVLCLLIVASMSVSAFAAEPATNGLPTDYLGWYITASVAHIRATANGTSLGLVYKYDTCNNYGLYGGGTSVGGHQWREVEMTSGVNDGKHGFVAAEYTKLTPGAYV